MALMQRWKGNWHRQLAAASHSRNSKQTSLLVVWHSRTGLAQQMTDFAMSGAHAAAAEMECAENFKVIKRRACDASVDDLLAAHGYLFCAPENLASVSGEMLEFFHRSYYQVFTTDRGCDGQGYTEISKLLGRPFGIAVAAGSDGSNAARQMERICRGWRLTPVTDTLICKNGQPQTAEAILRPKSCPPEVVRQCADLGGLLAATLLLQHAHES
mmetsp:Transcript_62267/g.103495  ORF Transcript_62267/g.103495 Transcript_62267/m.103495 type:complete len:214 (-) Transcript_62267:195-836(-)|eukprot:CAMPEP_0119315942 /NCGR_PEP_ID=MMETSP1333-20130426/37856_1 /TAXON_ID=418940 /ORGANISM="Scyphosphaera apsteinii, Strain RCC1455" /LENGTH=213 /DNA_ID=CAMNT_0007321447 /DNA_START=16 /DNA_END=657 /DNA_ORIENTATION=+